MTAEGRRLAEAKARTAHWKRWGPYLSERQWGTVREDYSPHGTAWDYFPHDHARSRAYRWGEDGILGISDNHQRLCFALALVCASAAQSQTDPCRDDITEADGYAIRAEDVAAAAGRRPVRLTVIGEVAAGGTPDVIVAPGTAIRIATGAPLPPGATAVVAVEETTPIATRARAT